MTGPDLARHAGITYRQVDLWTRAGYLMPVGDAEPGTGHYRDYSWAEVRVAAWMARLVAAGFAPAAAARMARGDKQARMAALSALTDGWLEESA